MSEYLKVVESYFTKAILKEQLSHKSNSDIVTMSLKCSLLCPLSKSRIQCPSRAFTCKHIQCFDAITYFQINSKDQKWVCPICSEPALSYNLFIDGLFNEILNEAPLHCNQVEFGKDGKWTPVIDQKVEILNRGHTMKSCCEKHSKIEVITIDSSDSEDNQTIIISDSDISSSSVEDFDTE